MPDFEILRMQVCHWGYAPLQEPIEAGLGTLLLGLNGSGKTTLLMAAQAALGQDVPNVHKYIYPGRKWAWVRIVVNNRAVDGRRPFGNWVPNSAYDDCITLAVLFERKDGWQRTYYVAPGDSFQPEPAAKSANRNWERTRGQYREMLDDLGILDVLLRLYRIGITGLPEKLQSPKASFRFFFDLMGEQATFEQYQDAKRTWSEHALQTEEMANQAQRERLQLEQHRADLDLGKRRRALQARAESYDVLAVHVDLRDTQDSVPSIEQAQATLTAQVVALDKSIAGIELEQREVAETLADKEAEHTAWNAGFVRAQEEFGTASAEFRQGETALQASERLVARLRALPDEPVARAEARLAAAAEREFKARTALGSLTAERDELTKERARLEKGRPWLPDEVADMQAALDRAGIPNRRVSEALNITDPEWAYAIEGVLAGDRFRLVVEDRAERVQAMRIAQDQEYPHWVSRARPLTEADRRQSVHPDSLWHLVEVLDENVAGWVYERLAHVRRVDDVDAGERLAQQGHDNITRRGYLQNHNGGRSLLRWLKLACGGQALAARLREVQARLDTLDDLVDEAQTAYRLAQIGANSEREAVKNATERQRLPEVEATAAKQRTALEAAADRLQAAITRLDQDNARNVAWMAEIGTLRERRASLAGEHLRAEQSLKETRGQLRSAEGRLREARSRVEALRVQADQLRALLPGEQERLTGETFPADHYRALAEQSRADLAAVPEPRLRVTDEMFLQEEERLTRREQEVEAMREREEQYCVLMEAAHQRFRQYIDRTFNDAMNRNFRTNCQRIGAVGSIRVTDPEGNDNWEMVVSAGFGGKNPQPLEDDMLSQGEKVTVGLLAVLAAVQALGAAPLLVLDDFLGTLDAEYASEVLARARDVGCQYVVSTCQNRPELTAGADALWVCTRRRDGAAYATPVKVQLSATEALPA